MPPLLLKNDDLPPGDLPRYLPVVDSLGRRGCLLDVHPTGAEVYVPETQEAGTGRVYPWGTSFQVDLSDPGLKPEGRRGTAARMDALPALIDLTVKALRRIREPTIRVDSLLPDLHYDNLDDFWYLSTEGRGFVVADSHEGEAMVGAPSVVVPRLRDLAETVGPRKGRDPRMALYYIILAKPWRPA